MLIVNVAWKAEWVILLLYVIYGYILTLISVVEILLWVKTLKSA